MGKGTIDPFDDATVVNVLNMLARDLTADGYVVANALILHATTRIEELHTALAKAVAERDEWRELCDGERERADKAETERDVSRAPDAEWPAMPQEHDAQAGGWPELVDKVAKELEKPR